MAEGIVARGKKTIIRWFERADVDKRQKWSRHTDPLYSHNDPRPMGTRERDLWFLERSASANYRMFAIDDLNGNLIGWITIRNINAAAGSSVLGIALEPTKMDQGYGTDALMAFFGYYFGTMGFKEIWLDVAAFNHRAMRCYEKCSFRYVGKHWMEHPASAFPPVLSDPKYKEVACYFRRSLLGIEVLYYDMMLDRATYYRHRAKTDQSAPIEERSGNKINRRVAGR